MILVHFQGKPFNITVIQVCNQWCQRSWVWPVLWRPIRPSGTNTKKRCRFHHRGLKCESRKSRATQNNRQIWPWSTKWCRAKANRILLREHTGHSKHFSNKPRCDTWTSPDGQYCNQNEFIFCSQRWRSSTQSTKIRPEADYGSDHELLTAKFRFKLKKVGKSTRPFRYDLNQTPYIIQRRWGIDSRD